MESKYVYVKYRVNLNPEFVLEVEQTYVFISNCCWCAAQSFKLQ